MYFDDFELDLDLANSFDALVDEELGQEVSVDVSIPSSQLPTKTEIEVIPEAQKHGMEPTMSGLPGQGGRQRIDIIPKIAREVEQRRQAGEDPDVGALTAQRIREHREAQALAKLQQAEKAFAALGEKISTAPRKPMMIQAPQETSDFKDLQRSQMVDEIVKNVSDRLLPRLKKIDKRLKLAQAQAKATDEHNIIMERELFRKKVINDLKWLSQLLPNGHPIRDRIDRL